MVSLASLLRMACSTFMVIAPTSAFCRPTVKERIGKETKKKKKSAWFPSVMMSMGTLECQTCWICSGESALIQADPVFVVL